MKKILQKVLAELQKESPDLSYIRGMLEVLIGDDSEDHGGGGKPIKITTNTRYANPPVLPDIFPIPNEELDEGAILDAKAKAAVAEVKRLSDIAQNA